MKIRIYSLSRSGHHAISFWLAKNFVPHAAVEHTYDKGNGKMHMVSGSSDLVLDLLENEHIQPSSEPTIIILRDPYNNYASFMRMLQNPNFGVFSFVPFIEYWTEYANEFVGETNLLTNKVVISYNDWVDSLEYRQSIVEKIGQQFGVAIKFDDSQKENMTQYGGGSSFDGMVHYREASKMRVHERYKEYERNSEYRNKIDTPKVKDLSDKIFKFYPWTPVEKKGGRTMTDMMRDILG